MEAEVVCQAPNEAALSAIGAAPADSFLRAKAKAVMRAWIDAQGTRFAGMTVEEVEAEYSFPLINPSTQAASRSFLDAGKIDAIVFDRGERKVVEHKTTGDSIDPAAPYWDRLEMDSQVSKGFLACVHSGAPATSMLYNVIRRPAHRPGSVPELDKDGLKIVVIDSTGERAKTKDGKWRQSATEGMTVKGRPETEAEFEERVFGEVSAAPERYFAVREVPRLDSDLLEYMKDAWATSQQILIWRREEIWPRTPAACTAFGVCQFIPLCARRSEPEDATMWRKAERSHEELSAELQKSDLQLLTVSRINALRECAKLHYWLYEACIRPVREDEETRAFGTLIHLGLEAFLKAVKGNSSVNN